MRQDWLAGSNPLRLPLSSAAEFRTVAVARSFRTGHFASPICKFLSAFALDRHTSLLCFNVLSANPMKTLTLPVYLVAVAFSLSTALAGDSPNGAKTALGALPPHFAREVVRLSADSGRPNPAKWYVLARNPEEAGLIVKNPLYSITIARGQLSEAKRYLDARQIFNQKKLHRHCKGAGRLRRGFSNRKRLPRACRTEDGERQLSAHPNRTGGRSHMGRLGLRQIQPLYWRG